MVFESVVTDILNRILGDYVQNLDSKQLKIGIWGGDVVLNNLILKHSALDDLNLPVQIKYGSLGKLVLKIPWSNLYGASCECFLDSLYLLVVPNNDVTYNEEKESKWEQEAKQAELKRIEQAKKDAESKDAPKVDNTFVEKLTMQIIKNVQVKINNIHVRYEDKVTNPTHPFCLGMTLSNLSIITTDSEWKATVVQDMVAKIYKELELEGLAVYWNSDSVLYSNLPTEELEQKLQQGIATKTDIPTNYVYMLGPINSNVRLQLNPKPEMDEEQFSIPKLILNFEMQKLAIGISKVQYRDVMLLVDSMERMSKASVYRKYRPAVPYKGHAKEWWKFAYRCIVEENIKRVRQNWDWQHMLEHRRNCKEYARLYQQKLTNKKVPKQVEEDVENLEKILDVVNIVIIRQKIAIEVERLGKLEEEKKKTQTWISRWWGGSSSTDDDSSQAGNIIKKFQDAITPEEKKKLFAAIDYQENTSPTQYPITFVATVLKFNLHLLQIDVKDDSLPNPKVLSLDINDVNCCIENRPAASAIKVVVSVNKMLANGLKQHEVIPQIITTNCEENFSLLDVLFEKNPLDNLCNQRVHLTAHPLRVYYDAATVIKLVEIFKAPEEISTDFAQLSAAADAQLENFKEFSNVGLQHIISQHDILDLNVLFHAPYIIVPYKGFYTGKESVMVANLGKLEVSTKPRSMVNKSIREMHNEGYDEERIHMTIIEQSYDRFTLQFKDLQVVIATKEENWEKSIHGSEVTPLHLLQPLCLSIELGKCVVTDDPRLPKMKINGWLDSLDLCLTDARILLLMSLINSIPLPSDDLPEPQGLKRDSISKLSTMSLNSAKRLELGGLLKKPSQVASSIKQTTTEQLDNQNLVQFTNLYLNFELKVLSVVLQHQDNLTTPPNRLIYFSVESLKAELTQQTFNMKVNLSLGSINMVHYLMLKEIQIIHTPRLGDGNNDDLFSVKFLQVDKKSPDFNTIHNSCEKWVQLDFTRLHVLLHQESLINIVYRMNDFNKKFSKIHVSDRVSSTNATSVKTTFPDLNLEKKKLLRKYKNKNEENPIIDFKLTAKIQEVKVCIENDMRPLAALTIKGLCSEVTITQLDTRINVTLNNIAIYDENQNTIHKMILTQINEDEAMNLLCVIYNTEFGTSADVDMKIKLSVTGLRIIFLNWFTSSILDFLNRFQRAQALIIEASQAAAQSARENLNKAYEKATKIDLHIDIKAPDIVVPLNSKSKEALLLDMGYISITNQFIFFASEGHSQEAVIDNMDVKLKQIKLSTVIMDLDNSAKYLSEVLILQPVTFALQIKRNLSLGWFKNVPNLDISGQIESFNISLGQDDFALILKILDENFKEGQDTKKIPNVRSQTSFQASGITEEAEARLYGEDSDADINADMSERKSELVLKNLESSLREVEEEEEADENKVYIAVKFTFTLNTLIINFYGSNNVKNTPSGTLNKSDILDSHSSALGLARFSLEVLSVKGRILTDGTLTTSLVLVNFLMDDTRIGRENMLTRYLQRKATNDMPQFSAGTTDLSIRSMVDLTYQKKDSDSFVDCRISSFQLVLAMDYLIQILNFLMGGMPKVDAAVPAANAGSSQATMISSTQSKKRSNNASSKPSTQSTTKPASMSINLKIEKPDIILIEHMSNDDRHSLVLNGEILIKLRTHGAHLVVNGTMSNFQLNICMYSSKGISEKVCSVLHPMSISVAGSTPLQQGLHLEIIFTDIRLSVSPTTIELLSNIYNSMISGAKKDETLVDTEDVNYNDIWEQQKFTCGQYWFLGTETAEEALTLEIVDVGADFECETKFKKEMCVVTVPSIVITCEAGVGNKTLPMLMLYSSFLGTINDWSSQMFIDAKLTLQMGYYNSRLALWEPFIEPVEKQNETTGIVTHEPWELKFEMQMNNQEEFVGTPMSPVEGTDSLEEIQFQQPVISINISSDSNLETTITKTGLEVLTNLGKAFSSAIQTGEIKRSDTVAPYIIRNDCGLQVTLLLDEGCFTVCNADELASKVVLESGASVNLQSSKDKSMSTTDLLNATMTSANNAGETKMLSLKVEDLNCQLSLPVYRADKRFFPLKHRDDNKNVWGLISDISVEEGSLLVVLRSILKVYNHLKAPVEIYYMTSRGNELESIAIIDPGTSCNLPLKAVYTPTSELFFSVEGFSVTASPFIWKDLQHDLTISKLLQCTPKNNVNSTEPFIMKVIGEIEQVYNENTLRHTMSSTCYNIHLRAAVVLKNCLPVKVTCMIQNNMEEKEIKPGYSLQLPNVDPGKSYIIVRIPEYLEKDWSCKREIPSQANQFTVWQFDSYDSAAKMSMDLGMHNENKNGTIELTLYCPNWMLNKTGLLLAYRSSDENQNVLYHPSDIKTPIMFSYNAKNFLGKKKAAIRIEQGEWSDKFSLDVAGSAGVVACKANNMIYQIGVSNQLTYNGLTKQITFTPYYVIINNAKFPIECQELERPADPWTKVEPESCSALWPKSMQDDKLLVLRVCGTSETTAPFLYTEMHTTLLKLKNQYGGIHVDVQMTEGSVYIVLTSYLPGNAPALIINHTPHTMKFWEKESVVLKTISPSNSLLFTWEKPAGSRLLMWDIGRKKELQDDLRKDGVGSFKPTDDCEVFWVSFLDGMQRVLLFTTEKAIAEGAQSAGDLEAMQQEISLSIYGLGISFVNNYTRQEIMYIGITGSGIIWETCKLSSKRYKQMSVRDSTLMEASYQQFLQSAMSEDISMPSAVIVDNKMEVDFIEGLMLKPHKRRVRRTFLTGLWLQMKTSPQQLQLHGKIHRLQIDNQMYDCIFPVVLAPVPPPKSVAANSMLKPFAEVSIVQRLMKHSKIQQYKYYKVLIQEFHIKVDMGFVNAVLELIQSSEQSEQEAIQQFEEDMQLMSKPLLAHVSSQSVQEQKSFYDLLHFSPLKIHVSFSLATGQSSSSGSSSDQGKTPPFMNVLLQGVGVTLTDLNDVVFRLAYFQHEYTFLTQRQLISEVKSHYVGQAIKQLYVLVLGLDVLGNPYGLVVGFTKGVEDLFYEPFQGAIQGPGEFAEGLVLGVRSLFGHTVGGAAGAVSRITGAMGKGLAVLTFDKEYQRKRRDQQKKRPANIQEEIARGGKGLVMGVFDGVTGVFTKPISGAKEQGVEGFFKGLGKGAVGLVTRPTAGVIDFASGSFDFVKRATEIGEETLRLRPPRYLPGDGMVRAYIRWEALGNKLVMELEKGKYANTDIYAYHVVIVENKDYLLMTDKRIAYVVRNDIFGSWQIDWAYTWQEITSPAKVVPKGVQITTGESKKKVLGLFGHSDVGKIILIGETSLRKNICLKIEELRKNA